MLTISDDEFETLINESLDELPKDYITRLENVAIVLADVPDEHQIMKSNLQPGHALFGLYEGVPLTQRGAHPPILPDKITIFKHPMVNFAEDVPALKEQVKRTLWHEIAHYFGLDHEHISALENK